MVKPNHVATYEVVARFRQDAAGRRFIPSRLRLRLRLPPKLAIGAIREGGNGMNLNRDPYMKNT